MSTVVSAPAIEARRAAHGTFFFWLSVVLHMVRTQRTAVHRRLGIVGAIIGAAVVFAGPMVWGNFVSIAVFAGLLAAALLLRHRPQAHKRLIVLASIAIVAPALARISRWPMLGGEDGAFIPLALVALLLSVVAHDLFSMRRLHTATWVGCAVIVLGAVAQQLIAGSEVGLDAIRSMGGPS